MEPIKFERGKPIFTREPIALLNSSKTHGLFRLATKTGHDIFEALVVPGTPVTNLRYCGSFNDYREPEGATRPEELDQWAVTLVETVGEAAAGHKG